MDEVARLLLDGPDHLRVPVAGGVDRDARGEVQEQVAVDVFDGHTQATNRHDRVGAGQARRGPLLVELDVRACLGAGNLGDEVRKRPVRDRERRTIKSCGLGHGGTSEYARVYAGWIVRPVYQRPCARCRELRIEYGRRQPRTKPGSVPSTSTASTTNCCAHTSRAAALEMGTRSSASGCSGSVTEI